MLKYVPTLWPKLPEPSEAPLLAQNFCKRALYPSTSYQLDLTKWVDLGAGRCGTIRGALLVNLGTHLKPLLGGGEFPN